MSTWGRLEHWAVQIRSWRELELRDVWSWPVVAQRSLSLALGLSLLIIWSLFLGRSMWDEVSAARMQLAQVQAQIKANTQSLARVHGANERDVLALSQQVQRRLPSRLQVQQSLSIIDELARQHNIQLESVRVEAAKSLRDHQAQIIRIEALGDFHDWGHWLAALLKAEPVMWVSALDARTEDAQGVTIKVVMSVVTAAQALPKAQKS